MVAIIFPVHLKVYLQRFSVLSSSRLESGSGGQVMWKDRELLSFTAALQCGSSSKNNNSRIYKCDDTSHYPKTEKYTILS